MDLGFLIMIVSFIIYYILVLFFEKKMIREPRDIIEKFLSIILLYAGISLIYFSITGKPFLTDTTESYSIYIFIIGFIAILWTIPNLLKEFKFFQKFLQKKGNSKSKNKEQVNIKLK